MQQYLETLSTRIRISGLSATCLVWRTCASGAELKMLNKLLSLSVSLSLLFFNEIVKKKNLARERDDGRA
jgi:hypothetical protein